MNLLGGKEAGPGVNADLSFLACTTQAQKVESAAPMDAMQLGHWVQDSYPNIRSNQTGKDLDALCRAHGRCSLTSAEIRHESVLDSTLELLVHYFLTSAEDLLLPNFRIEV